MSIGSTIRVDAHQLDRHLELAAHELRPSVTRAVHRGGLLLRTTVRAKASGRPGPRVQTGDYRRGISLSLGTVIGSLGGPVPYATVYSDSPQGQRLENGFVGVDSLGRAYHQPAFPHWAPAAREVEPIVVREVDLVVDSIARRIAS